MVALDPLPGAIAEALLQLPDRDSRRAYLRAQGLWRATVLLDLSQLGEGWVHQEPGHCLRLAEAAAELADLLPAPVLAARMRYLQAQAHALLGDFAAVLPLTAVARAIYLAEGQPDEAARTYMGEMHALAALGCYAEALLAGEAALGLAGDEGLLPGIVAQNQGIVYHRQGRYDEALAAYARSAEIFRRQGASLHQGQVLNNRGVVLLSLGRGREAAATFDEAAQAFDASNATLQAAQARSNQGAARLLLGDYQQALADFEDARQALESLVAAETATLLMDTASAYLALNLYPEALAASDSATDAFQAAGLPYETGQALLRRAAALSGLQRWPEAQSALATAAERFASLDNAPWQAIVRLEQAALWQQAGRIAEARAAAASALAVYQAQDMPGQAIYAHLRLAEIAGQPAEAEEHLAVAQRLADELAIPALRYRALAGRGRFLRQQQRIDEARRALDEALELLEAQRAGLAHEALRVSFLGDKERLAEDLVAVCLASPGPDGPRQAFEAAERSRARSLRERLGRPATSGDRLAATASELAAELDGLYSALLSIDLEREATTAQRAARRQALFERIHQVEQARQGVRVRLLSNAAGTGQAGGPISRAATLDETRAALPPATSLIAYQRIDKEWLAFVLEADGLRVVRSLLTDGELAADLERLGTQWQRFRLGDAYVRRHARQVLRSTDALLMQLFERLVRPLDVTTPQVVVIPFGPLHGIPFHALHDGQGYWLERVEVVYAASASLFAWAESRPRPRPASPLAVGLSDAGIPQVAGELAALAAAFPAAEILQDGQATRENLRQAAAGRDALHIACHGIFRADNPMLSALRLADGWLMAEEIEGLNLSADLVTLSACQSGRSQVAAGDELLGLARPFLATAVSLVVSQWLVHDETAAGLMSRFYQALAAGQRPAAALRAAQLAAQAETPHPYYWAPFICLGQLFGQETP